MNSRESTPTPSNAPSDEDERLPPIKLPNPPEETQPEIPKVGSRDAPGG